MFVITFSCDFRFYIDHKVCGFSILVQTVSVLGLLLPSVVMLGFISQSV